MKLFVYSIFDSRAGQYLTPTFESSDAVAARNFSHAVATSGSILTSHRFDFSLVRIGVFDVDSGEIDSYSHSDFELILRGADVDVH